MRATKFVSVETAPYGQSSAPPINGALSDDAFLRRLERSHRSGGVQATNQSPSARAPRSVFGSIRSGVMGRKLAHAHDANGFASA